MLRSIKAEIRIVGIDDGFFVPHTHGKCEVIGIVFRGGYWIDGVMRTQVEVDGMDATEKISHMITGSPHYGQLRVIMLDGVTLAGFNIVDTTTLFETTSLPVISVTRDRPKFRDIRKALENLPFTEERWAIVKRTQKITKVITGTDNECVFMQAVGVDIETAKRIVESTATRSNIPEPLRVAHLIASGVTSPLV